MTKSQIHQIPVLLRQGKTVQQIATLYQTHINSIYYWIKRLRRAGYTIPKSKGGRPRIKLSMDGISKEYDGEVLTDEEKEIIDNCNHICTSNCRRNGCNCDCGEFHITK